MKTLRTIFVFWLIFFSSFTSVLAASSLGLKPALSKEINLTAVLSPGESKTINYVMVNLSDQSASVSMRLADLDKVTASGQYIYKNSTASSELEQLIRLDQTQFYLEPGQRTELSLHLQIAPDIEPGQYLGGLLAESGSGNLLAASKIDLKIKGDLAVKLDWKIKPEVKNDQLYLDIVLYNQGNIALKDLLLQARLKNQTLSQIIKVEREALVPIDSTIMPGDSLTLPAVKMKLDPWGQYQLDVKLIYNENQVLTHHQSLQAVIVSQITAIVLVVLGLLLLIGFGLYLFVRWFVQKRKQVKAMNQRWKQLVDNLLSGKPKQGFDLQSASADDKDIKQIKQMIAALHQEIKALSQKIDQLIAKKN